MKNIRLLFLIFEALDLKFIFTEETDYVKDSCPKFCTSTTYQPTTIRVDCRGRQKLKDPFEENIYLVDRVNALLSKASQ